MKPLSILLAALVLCCGSELSRALAQGPDQIRLEDCVPITASNFTQVQQVHGVITDEELLDLAWASQGDSVAVAGETDVWLYNLANLNRRRSLGFEKIEGVYRTIASVAYSPDGTLLVVGDAAGGLSVWDATSLEKLASFPIYKNYRNALSALAFNSDGTVLASGSLMPSGSVNPRTDEDGGISLWDTGTWTPHTVTLSEDEVGTVGGIEALAFSPDDTLLAVAGSNKVVLFEVATQTWLPLPDHYIAWDVAFGHGGQLLAAATGTSKPQGLWLWDIERQVLRDSFKSGNLISSVAFASDGIVIAIGMESFGNIYLWDTNASPNDPDKSTVLWIDEGQTVADLEFSPDGKLLASVAGHALNLWGVCEGVEPE